MNDFGIFQDDSGMNNFSFIIVKKRQVSGSCVRNRINNSPSFGLLAGIVELDSDMMHAVMMTSNPALHYWLPASLDIMKAVRVWRHEGISACYTVDAGPNVHVLCADGQKQEVAARLAAISGVKQVLMAAAGGPARLVEEPNHRTR
jgi:diphosphomevalonate decarboxylase